MYVDITRNLLLSVQIHMRLVSVAVLYCVCGRGHVRVAIRGNVLNTTILLYLQESFDLTALNAVRMRVHSLRRMSVYMYILFVRKRI